MSTINYLLMISHRTDLRECSQFFEFLCYSYSRSTYIPDYLNGDPITEEMFSSTAFSREAWFKNHGNEQTRPSLDAVIKGLQDRGITTFGASGYCMSFSPYLYYICLLV
jgi:hypothetical protein